MSLPSNMAAHPVTLRESCVLHFLITYAARFFVPLKRWLPCIKRQHCAMPTSTHVFVRSRSNCHVACCYYICEWANSADGNKWCPSCFSDFQILVIRLNMSFLAPNPTSEVNWLHVIGKNGQISNFNTNCANRPCLSVWTNTFAVRATYICSESWLDAAQVSAQKTTLMACN